MATREEKPAEEPKKKRKNGERRRHKHHKTLDKHSGGDNASTQSNDTAIQAPIPETPPQPSVEEELAKKDLLLAILSKDLSTIPDLIQKVLSFTNGNINYRDAKDRTTLLHKAVQQRVGLDIIRILIENGARVDMRDSEGCSALHIASELGDPEVVEFLLKNQANSMLKDKDNRICLHKAAQSGNVQVLDILMQHPVLINHQDNQGHTALHLAVQAEKRDSVEFLIHHNADVTITSRALQRPLDMVPFTRATKSGKPVYTPEGKKIRKYLKRKGGAKVPHASTVSTSSGFQFRSFSLDHRAIAGQKVNSIDSPRSSPRVEYDLNDDDDEHLAVKPVASTGNLATPRLNRHGFVVNEQEEVVVPTKAAKKTAAKQEKRAMKWLELISNWDLSKNRAKIQKYCDEGIPDSVRSLAWRMLSGIGVEGRDGNLYHTLLQEQQWDEEIKDEILRDINRTMPDHILFKEKGQGQKMLTNVLLSYSAYKPEVGYCQGMGFVTAMFLMYMTEEDAFWMLDAVSDNFGFAAIWEASFVQLRKCMHALTSLMQQFVPVVYQKLEENFIPPISYGPQFFITGFLVPLPFEMVVRVWDIFWLRKYDFFYAVALAIFKLSQEPISSMGMDDLMSYLNFKDRKDLGFDTEQLISHSLSYVQRFKSSQLRSLEAEYQKEEDTTVRSQYDRSKHKFSLRKKARKHLSNQNMSSGASLTDSNEDHLSEHEAARQERKKKKEKPRKRGDDKL